MRNEALCDGHGKKLPSPRERHRQQDLDPPDVFPSPPPTHDNSWLHPPRSLRNTLGPHALLPKPREHLLRRSGRSCRRALARDGESGARCRLASRISHEAPFDPLLKDLDLQIGPRRLAFTSENLILSFSLPNFYFHAVTAYDILRARGVPLGKRDYEGRLRTRTA